MNLFCIVLQKRNLSPRIYRVQMQLTKISKLKNIHSPGKNLSHADMLNRSFTKAELQINQLKHKQLPPQIEFAVLQINALKPDFYHMKNMTLIQFLLIMVHINFQDV